MDFHKVSAAEKITNKIYWMGQKIKLEGGRSQITSCFRGEGGRVEENL